MSKDTVNSRYVIGIDLGTTNTALSWYDTQLPADEGRIVVQEIAQLVEPGEVAPRPLLPSFLYVPGALDFAAGSTALPWDEKPQYVVGELARKRGAETPGRLIASAKSWLSYGGASRTTAILPWGAAAEVPKLSPVDVSAEYLKHLVKAFEQALGQNSHQSGKNGKNGKNGKTGNPAPDLKTQDVLLTVPASFDVEARELTQRAAEAAGLQHVTLLEEPQAALYAWLDTQGDRWRGELRVGDLVLVCDVGGGTTDFSLIAVAESAGELALERVAVGEHILLGGDNMDLALARLMQQRLQADGHRVETAQIYALWHQCRLAKEALLRDPTLNEHPITLLGRGSKLIGGTITTQLTRVDVSQVLLDGFFPVVASNEMPARKRMGLQEIGLPYAADTAVTRHLARFLTRAGEAVAADAAVEQAAAIRRSASGLACPTHVLFNGGVMKAEALHERVVQVLDQWLAQEGFGPIKVLAAPDLDHAVARGAVYYGMARRGSGIRIRSGAARSYYIGIESSMPAVPGLAAPLKALCVVPFGMEEGASVAIPEREFGLVIGEPAEFRFLSSTVRKQDTPGEMIEDWGDDLEELAPLEVTLKMEGQKSSDEMVPVMLQSHVNEVGTLELWCVARDQSRGWKLELNIRERES